MMRVGSIMLSLLLACSVLYSEERLTEEKARTLINEYKARERVAKEKIAIEMAKIEQLRKEIAALDAEILKLEAKLKELKIKVNEDQLKEITKKVKDLGGLGKRIVEEDLIAIAEDVIGKTPKEESIVELIDITLETRLGEKPRSSVILKVKGVEKKAEERGVGPVDATLNAIKKALGEKNITLDEYHLDAITGGSDALADVTIRVGDGKRTTMARGVHEDVVMASIIAFINGINRIMKL